MVGSKKRGRPATGRGQTVGVRLHLNQIEALDAWIEAQGVPRKTRPEAIRTILDSALSGQHRTKTLDEKIARAKRTIAKNPARTEGDASPAKGMATLRRGLAETELRTLKARRGKRSRSVAPDTD